MQKKKVTVFFSRSFARQQGQALIYLIALMVPIAIGIGFTYNAFYISNERTRLQNTTDAVAYSVAALEARDLNFKAYTNRAMVANQVAIAQAVGLVSWSRWASTTTDRLADYTRFIPVVGQYTETLDEVMQTASPQIERAMPILAEIANDQVSLMSRAQQDFHYTTNILSQEVIDTVIQANDPAVSASLTLGNYLYADYTAQHQRFSRRYNPDQVREGGRSKNYYEHFNRMEEFREITMDSLDGFSKRRTYNLYSFSTGLFKEEIRRAGGTELTGRNSHYRYGSWIAMDTLSYHHRHRGCGWGGSWCSWDETPIGWGAAKNARQQEYISFNHKHNRGRDSVGESWRKNKKASKKAFKDFQNARETEGNSPGYLGLQKFFDLQHDGLIQKGPGIKILLAKPRSQLHTTKNIGFNSGSMDMENSVTLPQSSMLSMAKAAPYFARMTEEGVGRADGRREYGNLYNPYWQPRLEALTEAEKQQIQALVGVR